MTLRTPSGEEVTFINKRPNHLSNVIFIATARIMVQKGCEAYLVYVIDTKKVEPSFLDTPTVCDYPDVFLEELPGLPPQGEMVTLFRMPLRHPLHHIEWLRWS